MAQLQTSSGVKDFNVVSKEEWLKARRELLKKEKEFTKLRDQMSALRREMPWEKVQKSYVFEGPNGKESLADLFGGKSQLVVYHFMFAPEAEAACRGCSFWADNFDGIDVHLRQRDTTFLAISRAPYAKLNAFAQRMGWHSKFVSSFGSDFNFDFYASFTPEQLKGVALNNYEMSKPNGPDTTGVSVFVKDLNGDIYHSYSCYSRGVDMLNVAYHYLDLTPKGRDEADQKPHPMAWVRLHDQYADAKKTASCCASEARA